MAKQIRITPILIAVVILAALLVYLFMPKEEAAKQRQGRQTPVNTEVVAMMELPLVVEALGTARANEAVTITAQETDLIESLAFDDGDLVQAKQMLVQLNAREERARVRELEANLKEAKRQLARVADLAKDNAASEQLLDEQQAEVDSFISQLEVAKAQLADRAIRSPFAGVLGIRQVSIGALVRPGDTITTLDDIGQVKVDFSIAESHLPSVAIGQGVEASSVAYPGKFFDGTITSIATRVDPVTRSILVRAVIENPQLELRPGMLLQITVQKRVLSAMVVPETALVPIQDKQFVYLVEDGTAKQVEVTIGERKPGLVQILSGLKLGDEVVTGGTLRLRDGAQVRVVEG